MATRIKTVQFAFPMTTSDVTDAVVTNLTQITVYIPETVSSFISATVDVGFQDIISVTGGTIGEHRAGLRLGAAAYTTVTETDDITNSGENIAGVIGPFNFTSHFTTNWTGTSMTCDVQVYFDQTTGTTLGMRNVTAVLTLTYEYDDTAATQIKTAWIPLESLVGALTTTANSNIGTSQIPQLTGTGGMLPEASVAIRDYYFLIEGNEATSAATDFTVSVNIDGGTSTAFGIQEAALASGRYCRWIYKPAVPTTTSTHNFQMWSSLAARLNHVVITLVVTYEFSESSTTSVLNSIILPLEIGSPLGAINSTYASRYQRDVFIAEPGTIVLKQSAFRINFNVNATPTGLNMRAGSQSYRAYTPYGGVVCGMLSMQQRIDSGGAQGAGITLARGKNTVTIDGYITVTTNQMTNISGYFMINYQSDKSTAGIGAHNHTVFKNLYQWDALLQDRIRVDSFSFAIPESNYRISSVGFAIYHFVATGSEAITMDAQCLTTEGKGGGYYDIYGDAYQSDAERSSNVIYMNGRDVFKRYPVDPAVDRVDIESARSYRFFSTTTSSNGMMMLVTYHSIAFTVSGNIYGSQGGTVTINVYRSDNNELVYTTTRSGDGAYSFTWYDDTIALYTEAYEDTGHYGRSTTATAGTDLDVVLSFAVARAFA
jgi:hypothetical protein